MATEITKLACRRDAMKKEKRELLKELKNKRKRLGRLKRKASQLSDVDLFDIVKSRHLKMVSDAPEANKASHEEQVPADPVPPSTD